MERMARRLVSLPESLCKKLDGLKAQGYTVSGFIRALLEREFNQTKAKKGG